MIHRPGWLCESVGMAQTVSVVVGAEDRARLAAVVGDRNRPQKHVQRARIVLLSAQRLPVLAVAAQAGVSRPSVWRWQQRFAEAGVDGLLRDKTRPPGKPPLSAETVARVLELPCTQAPGGATHWTGRAVARKVGISLRAVQRIWAAHRLQPHRIRTFKRSGDPAFAEKVEDIVGLYMTRRAMRWCCRSTRRANPGARPHPARPAAEARQVRHDDPRLQAQRHDDAVRRAERPRRPGRRPLHAAPPASGIHPVPQYHRARRSPRQDHPCDPRQLRHPQASKVRAWLADHPRWVFHFTPTSASWLNAVEGFFSILTRSRLKRGVFKSISQLQEAIARYIRAHNRPRNLSSGQKPPTPSSPNSIACLYLPFKSGALVLLSYKSGAEVIV